MTAFAHIPNLQVPHQQILNTTQVQPYIMKLFPVSFGNFCPMMFWEETYPATVRNPLRQRFFYAQWNKQGGCWFAPKPITPVYASIALMHINNDPMDTQESMPFFTTINLSRYKSETAATFEEVVAFAKNPNHQFSSVQKQALLTIIMKRYTVGHRDCQFFVENWKHDLELFYGHELQVKNFG